MQCQLVDGDAIEALKHQTFPVLFLALPSLCSTKKKRGSPRAYACAFWSAFFTCVRPRFPLKAHFSVILSLLLYSGHMRWEKDLKLPASLHFQTSKQHVGMWGNTTWSGLKVSNWYKVLKINIENIYFLFGFVVSPNSQVNNFAATVIANLNHSQQSSHVWLPWSGFKGFAFKNCLSILHSTRFIHNSELRDWK